MERLTARTHDGHAYLANVKDDEQAVDCKSRNTAQCIMDSWDRLADYEDTGLTPEEVLALIKGNLTDATVDIDTKAFDLVVGKVFEKRYGATLERLDELAAADKDGRCIVLPCKVGDICYEVDPGHPGVIEHTVTATTIYSKKADGKRYMEDFSNLLVIETYAVAEDGCEWTDQYTAKEWADAPKTRPEAEAALNDAHKPGGEQDA